jgi:hypothetical protein
MDDGPDEQKPSYHDDNQQPEVTLHPVSHREGLRSWDFLDDHPVDLLTGNAVVSLYFCLGEYGPVDVGGRIGLEDRSPDSRVRPVSLVRSDAVGFVLVEQDVGGVAPENERIGAVDRTSEAFGPNARLVLGDENVLSVRHR